VCVEAGGGVGSVAGCDVGVLLFGYFGDGSDFGGVGEYGDSKEITLE